MILRAILAIKEGNAAKGNPDAEIKRDVVSAMAGFKSKKTFVNNLAKEKKEGHLVCPSPTTVDLTKAGIEEAKKAGGSEGIAAYDPDQAVKEHHERLLDGLNARAKAVFLYLTDGSTRGKEDIFRDCGFDSKKTFQNVLGSMKNPKLGLLEYPESRTARLTDKAFPFGRP